MTKILDILNLIGKILLEWWHRSDQKRADKAQDVVNKSARMEKKHEDLRKAFNAGDRREFLRVIKRRV